MTDDLFKENNDLPPIDQDKDYWQELTGPGGKFHDPDENVVKKKIGKAKAESDNYIKTLERQLDISRDDERKLREEYQAGASLRELLDQYKAQQQQLANGDNQNAGPEVKEQPSLDPTQIDSLIEQKLATKEVERKFSANLNEVKLKLEERFGVNYQGHLKQHVAELGLDIEDVNALAKKSPKAFFKTLGLEDTRNENDSFQAPPRSQTRSDNFSPKTEVRDWAYYEKMRKDNPARYKDPRTHVQMHKDASEIDEKYGPGSFMRRK